MLCIYGGGALNATELLALWMLPRVCICDACLSSQGNDECMFPWMYCAPYQKLLFQIFFFLQREKKKSEQLFIKRGANVVEIIIYFLYNFSTISINQDLYELYRNSGQKVIGCFHFKSNTRVGGGILIWFSKTKYYSHISEMHKHILKCFEHLFRSINIFKGSKFECFV